MMSTARRTQPARCTCSTPSTRPLAALALGLVLAAAALPALAQTTVTDAWVRGTVAQQKATGLFATLTSAQGGRLVSASSPVAAMVEIHEMKMEGDTMRMRALDAGLALPAGQPVQLKPGGLHVMLMGLKQPLGAGDVVPVTLVVEGPKGRRETLELKVPVRPMQMPAGAAHGHKP